MIVFRDQRHPADAAAMLGALRSAADRFAAATTPPHDDVVGYVIDAGVFEAAVADALFPRVDGLEPAAVALRDASVAAGHLLWHSWRRTWHDASPSLARLRRGLAALAALPLPRLVETAAPEGFAQYGVYPEAYLEAARRHAGELRGRAVVCIGIRSIGTTLSAVVAAACEALGCEVTSFTIRPHGHPFDRRPRLDAALEAVVRARADRVVLVVDEGPGLSGSSFAGTAEALNGLGVPDENIIFLPSWRSDGRQLRSAAARRRWRHQRQLVVGFEEIWPAARLRDLSAGRWRDLLYEDTSAYPAVHPQHERRKYLAAPRLLRRFVGLGRYGAHKLARAEELAEARWSPRPVRLDRGFLEYEFVDGTPLTCRTATGASSASASALPDRAALDAIAGYLAHIGTHYATEPTVTDEAMTAMIETNVAEGLGAPWAAELRGRLPSRWSAGVERPAALDGRMLPHEWLRTPAGEYLKTDSVDHHADHFFPGCQDIAWDVGGACVEFALSPPERRRLIGQYRRLSGDRTIAARLGPHVIAYLAFRLGYARLAAETLGDAPDGRRFAELAARYASELKATLDRCSPASA